MIYHAHHRHRIIHVGHDISCPTIVDRPLNIEMITTPQLPNRTMTTQKFEAQNPDFISTIQESFARQGLLRHLNAELTDIIPGQVTIELPVSSNVSQQHGFVHAGAVTTIVDSACGYAALTLMPPQSEVLTIEYKANFMAPAQGRKLVAIGGVVKPGRTVTVCRGDVFMVDEKDGQKICATMLATMITRQL